MCPFCSSEVRNVKFHYLDMRICPKCYSTFFPCDQTMALRTDISDRSREMWYNALKAKNLPDPDMTNARCIDHGEPLVDGKLPDYGIEGKVTTCCKMFHLPPSLMLTILKRTLDAPFQKPNASGKHHFLFIRWADALVSRLFGEKMPEVDPLDELQYNLHLKQFFE